MDILKAHYCELRHIQVGEEMKLVQPMLDGWRLESQQGMFKTAMMSNSARVMELPFHVNPVTKLWNLMCANFHTQCLFSKYMKLAEIAMVHVLGSVEDERTFSSLAFLKRQSEECIG